MEGDNSSHPLLYDVSSAQLVSRMRRIRLRKKRVLTLFVVLLVFLYVTYKVMGPSEIQTLEEKEYRKLHVRQDLEGDPLHNRQSKQGLDIQQSEVVEALVLKYKLNYQYDLQSSPWKVAERWFSPQQVYPASAPEMGAVLRAMAEQPIISADVGIKGTQLKLTLTLEGGQRCVFKPKWYDKNEVLEMDTPYAGKDRYIGEIAAFHLSRVLELRRTPLTVGRRINLETDIKTVAKKNLLATFYKEGNNTCFYGRCLYCNGPETGVCADGDVLEGALVLWLPADVGLKKFRHPWARTYRANKLASWEQSERYCVDKILRQESYRHGRLLLDIIDTAVFDYLIYNGDRHDLEVVEDGYPDSMMLIIDNGKSFGNPYKDESSILAPLYQCCMIREKLWHRLMVLEDGVLSAVLAEIMNQDPLAPLLNDLHLKSLDRRLKHVQETVLNCLGKFDFEQVVIKGR